MAKRFTDTEKYKKKFYRQMPAAYKLLWEFICHDCDHAGIWHVDFDVAQLYIGNDAVINEGEALGFFNNGENRIEILTNGEKWFIRPFIEFQYGTLNPSNRVHLSILNILKKNKIKPLISPLLGAKDKDKDKDKVKDKDKTIHGEFKNVYLKKEEYEKLKDKFKTNVNTIIEKFSAYLPNKKGKPYTDHYAAILKNQDWLAPNQSNEPEYKTL
jgi:hypothetical protein